MLWVAANSKRAPSVSDQITIKLTKSPMPVHAMAKPLFASNTAAINGPNTLPAAEEDAVMPKNWPRHDGATKWLAIVFNMGKQRVADELLA